MCELRSLPMHQFLEAKIVSHWNHIKVFKKLLIRCETTINKELNGYNTRNKSINNSLDLKKQFPEYDLDRILK